MTVMYYDCDEDGSVTALYARPQRKEQKSVDIPDLSKFYKIENGKAIEIVKSNPLDVLSELEAWADKKAVNSPKWFSTWSPWIDRLTLGFKWWADGKKEFGKKQMLELLKELQAQTEPAPDAESVAIIKEAIERVSEE